MYWLFDIPNWHSGTRDGTYLDPQKSFVDFPDSPCRVLGQAKCHKRARCLWKSLGSLFLAGNWESMWKPHILSIFDFIKIIWLLVIFLTLFSENWPYLDNFDKNLFLLKWFSYMNRISPRFYQKPIFEQFLFICAPHRSKIRFLSKLPENGQFLLNKVQKIISN